MKFVSYLTRRMPLDLRERLRYEAFRRRKNREPRNTMEEVLIDALSVGLDAIAPRERILWDDVEDLLEEEEHEYAGASEA